MELFDGQQRLLCKYKLPVHLFLCAINGNTNLNTVWFDLGQALLCTLANCRTQPSYDVAFH